MAYSTSAVNISNREPSKEKAIETAVAKILADNPGYDLVDVSVTLKPDGSYNVVATLFI